MEQMTVRDLTAATKGRLLCGRPDTPVKNISLDSRTMKGEDLFVPLIGEKVDGHRFIAQAIGNGAVAVLTSEHDAADSDCAYIRVEDTKKALQAIGVYCRGRLSLPLVGVTGSVGKTTTREMIAAALSARYRVFKTPGNSNSQVGVPVTISEIAAEDEIGVIELGMSEPGELTVIAKIARIDAAVITNIGVTHIEQLGSRENIYREKMTIQDGLKSGGVLILNGDDDMLAGTRGKDGVRTVCYGSGENCDFRAEQVELVDGKARFIAVHGGERCPVRLNVLGAHNVSNALAALAVAAEYGMTMEEAALGLLAFSGFKHRQQLYEAGGITIFDDTYNASPVSMKAALDVLSSLKGRRRYVAVLADMKELGERTAQYHFEVGEYAAGAGVDLVVALGEMAGEMARGARARGAGTAEFLDRDELTRYLERELRPGDCVLMKGSNSMGLSQVADYFLSAQKRSCD